MPKITEEGAFVYDGLSVVRLQGAGSVWRTTSNENGPYSVESVVRSINGDGTQNVTYTDEVAVFYVTRNVVPKRTSKTGQIVRSYYRNAYPDDGLLNGVYYYYIGLK